MTNPSRKNASNTRGRPFKKGNPGRPKGARNRVTVACESPYGRGGREAHEEGYRARTGG